jgi:hypothetical protein
MLHSLSGSSRIVPTIAECSSQISLPESCSLGPAWPLPDHGNYKLNEKSGADCDQTAHQRARQKVL